MNKEFTLFVVITLLLSSLSVSILLNDSTVSASPNSLYVWGDAPAGWYNETKVRTIQEGIDNASSGDTVYVWEGNWYEPDSISIDKSVNIIGNSSSDVVISMASAQSLDIDSDGVNISNINITSGGSCIESIYDNINISNCLVGYNSSGTFDFISDNITLYNNSFYSGCGTIEMDLQGDNHTIEKNYFYINQTSFPSPQMDFSTENLTVRNNTFTFTGDNYAICSIQENNSLIYNNNFTNVSLSLRLDHRLNGYNITNNKFMYSGIIFYPIEYHNEFQKVNIINNTINNTEIIFVNDTSSYSLSDNDSVAQVICLNVSDVSISNIGKINETANTIMLTFINCGNVTLDGFTDETKNVVLTLSLNTKNTTIQNVSISNNLTHVFQYGFFNLIVTNITMNNVTVQNDYKIDNTCFLYQSGNATFTNINITHFDAGFAIFDGYLNINNTESYNVSSFISSPNSISPILTNSSINKVETLSSTTAESFFIKNVTVNASSGTSLVNTTGNLTIIDSYFSGTDYNNLIYSKGNNNTIRNTTLTITSNFGVRIGSHSRNTNIVNLSVITSSDADALWISNGSSNVLVKDCSIENSSITIDSIRNVSVENLDIKHANLCDFSSLKFINVTNSSFMDCTSIRVCNSDEINFSNNNITDLENGEDYLVDFSYSNNSFVSNNKMESLGGETTSTAFKFSQQALPVARSNHVIKNNTIANFSCGVFVSYEDNVSILNNSITNCLEAGLYHMCTNDTLISGNYISGDYCIYIEGIETNQKLFRNCTIRDNTLSASDNEFAVYAESFSFLNITNNTINSNGDGVYIYDCFGTNTSYNTITASYSIYIEANSGPSPLSNHTIYNNYLSGDVSDICMLFEDNITIDRNTLTGSNGCFLGTCRNITITNNSVRSSGTGINLDSVTNFTLYTNYIIDNKYGLNITSVTSTSNQGLIYNNWFENEVTNACTCDVGSDIRWNVTKREGVNIVDGPYIFGNYWHDYTGVDTDGDWIGNSVYNLPECCGGGLID